MMKKIPQSLTAPLGELMKQRTLAEANHKEKQRHASTSKRLVFLRRLIRELRKPCYQHIEIENDGFFAWAETGLKRKLGFKTYAEALVDFAEVNK